MEGLRRGLSRWKRYHIKVHLADEALLLPLTVRPRDTLSDLRAQLVGQGVSSWKRTFYYNARRLDDHQTVRDVCLQDGSVLLLVSDPRFWVTVKHWPDQLMPTASDTPDGAPLPDTELGHCRPSQSCCAVRPEALAPPGDLEYPVCNLGRLPRTARG